MQEIQKEPIEGSTADDSLVPTETLIRRIRAGDENSRDKLFRRYLPLLRRWAQGRLPASARTLADTDDLVQLTLMRTLARVEQFEARYQGSFLAYLRQVFLNEVRHEIRRNYIVPVQQANLPDIHDEDLPTMIDQLVGQEQLHMYQEALSRLPKRQQEVLIMRIEFGMTYPEIALETGSTPDAVRIMTARAAAELGKHLGSYRHE